MLSSVWLLRPHGLYSPWNSPGQNTGVGSLSLQGIFPTQGLNPGLPHCKQILYQLSHKGCWNTGGGCHFLLQGIFPDQESNPDLLSLEPWGKRNFIHCGYILVHFLDSQIYRFTIEVTELRKVLIRAAFYWVPQNIQPHLWKM